MNWGACKRTIHSTGKKRRQFIVKEENKWEKGSVNDGKCPFFEKP